LLIATLDRLFDQGLIGFDDNGTLLRHPRLTARDLQTLGVTEGMRLRLICPAHQPYLAAHRHAVGLST
jgi:putative restriction endonuclease